MGVVTVKDFYIGITRITSNTRILHTVGKLTCSLWVHEIGQVPKRIINNYTMPGQKKLSPFYNG